MRFGPLEITIRKAAPPNLASVDTTRGGWWPLIREPFAGAWQDGEEDNVETVVSYSAVFACVALISSDIAKMRVRLMAQDADGIWTETESPAFSPFLRKPNRYQNRIQFFKWWMTSKLLHGNTYALKVRDSRGVIVAMYILDPTRVRPLVAPDGSVFYELKRDNLSSLQEDVIVPASEIAHDVGCPLFHPLVGVSPIYACGLAAVEGLRIQNSSLKFFANGSQPGGVLTAPGAISTETAARMKTYWEDNFTGDNVGKVAVLGDGLKYEAMTVKATEAQLIEQLKWTAENVCTAYRVPAYKVGIGNPPNFNSVEALDQQYYSQCLQEHIESLELVLDEGLGLAPDKVNGQRLGVEFDLDDLMRMDTAALIKAEKEASGIKKVNESRRRLNLPPVDGGDTVYLQQQEFSLEALAKRDARPDPFSAGKTTPAMPAPTPQPDEKDYALPLMLKAAQMAKRNAHAA
jgi:HK97 family phage portal protein